MKKLMNKLFPYAGKINQRHIQILLVLVTLTMLVLGAGAPGMTGGPGGF